MSEELRARLARLRREEPRKRTPLPHWFAERLEGRLERCPGAPGASLFSLEPPARLAPGRNARGRFDFRLETHVADHEHGEWRLAEALAVPSAELALIARDPALAGLALERAVYLDIETTGLAGGAGTIPFLIALGSFVDGAFQLWQGFLRSPEEEAAALTEVAERIAAAPGVVSFFGKSFDRHRLEDKMRLHRIAPPFSGKPHLDLYYPLTRLYRGAFPDGRLATFERELCGVKRSDDLPGSLAPAQWFDFLAGRPQRLEAVFEHNARDVLSLVVLAAHLGRTRTETRADGRPLSGCGRARARAIGELHARRAECSDALVWVERALVRGGSDEGELWFQHAELLRRLGESACALDEFVALGRQRTDGLAARAWLAAARLAHRAGRTELLAEALACGPERVEATLTGRARVRALEAFDRFRRSRVS